MARVTETEAPTGRVEEQPAAERLQSEQHLLQYGIEISPLAEVSLAILSGRIGICPHIA